MELTTAILILLTGLVAGFFNTVAGGGSLLTLPVLIFLGLPPVIANATNRVAIAVQNIFAVTGFKRKGVSNMRYSIFLAVSATLGAIIGAKIALDIKGEDFERILSIVMVMVLILILWNPTRKRTKDKELMNTRRQITGVIVFFFVGIYGGFIQVGVGFIILAALTLVNGLDLLKANSIKVGVVLVYTLAAVVIFAYEGKIYWVYGLVLSIGNAAGGWIGSHWAVSKGEKWIRRLLIVAVALMAIKLSGLLKFLG